ncbi:MAG: class I SAM-dependent methyltransferase [Patescibacteria group bacterium]
MPKPRKQFRPRLKPAASSSWEPVAGWYADHLAQPGTFQSDLLFPRTLSLLKPVSGKRFLDIGCGEGTFAREMTRAGAAVVGIDASPALITRAKKAGPAAIEYRVADAKNFAKDFAPASFDGAVCVLAIQNIDPFETVFRDAGKVLKSGAHFAIVMNHPAFRQPRQSGWGWDEVRKLQYRRVDRYMSSYSAPIQAHPGSAPGVVTVSSHRPLSAYVGSLIAGGFVIDGFEEWISNRVSTRGPRAKAENVAREEIPMFLAIRARKA